MSRLQTGDLTGPDQLTIQQTPVDPYFRQPQNQAGHQLGQLAEALSALNPGLNNLASRYSDFANQQKVEAEQQAGAMDRNSIKDAVAAQGFRKQNRGSWSDARLRGFDMADAQATASLYPASIQNALIQSGLWNNEKANPQDVANTITQVRQQFMQQGQGSGPEWSKTFSQYAAAHEDRVMSEWLAHIGQVREVKAEAAVGNDGTAQLLSHSQLGSTEEAAQRWSDYMEKSYTNTVLFPAQMNKIKVQSFLSAHAAALNSGNTELAQRLLDMFEKVSVKDDNGKPLYLAQTQAGGDALAEMHNQLYYYNRQAKQQEEDNKQARIQVARDAYFNLEKQYDGKMPSEIPAIMPATKLPDGTDLREEMTKLGMDPDAQWSRKRVAGLAAKNQVRAEEADYATDQIAQWDNKIRDAKTAGDLNSAKDALYKMKADPAFQSAEAQAHLSHFQDTLEKVNEEFGPDGRDRDRGYVANKVDILRTARAYATEASASMRAANKSPLDAVGRFGTASLSDDGKSVEFTFGDIERDMLDAYNKQVDAVRNGRKFSDVTSDEYAKVGANIANQFKPVFQKRVQDIQADLKRQEQQEADQKSAQESANAIKDVATGRVIKLAGEDGVPTNDAIKNVLYASNRWSNSINLTLGHLGETAAILGGTLSSDPDNIMSAVSDLRGYASAQNADYLFFPKTRQHYATSMIKEYVSELRNGKIVDGTINFAPLNAVKSLEADLNNAENFPGFMDELKKTAGSGTMTGKLQNVQMTYAKLREAYLNLTDVIGLPTGDTSYQPAWVDWRTTPLFSRASDVTDKNLAKLQKHLKLSDSMLPALKAAQIVATEKRDQLYGPIE